MVLYHIDEMLSNLDGYYVRYSDDMLFVGNDYEKAMDILKSELEKMQMTLNPKKVEYLDANHWFKFLGYSMKVHNISLASTGIKTGQKESEKRTIKKRDTTMTKAINAVDRYLYKGYCDYSWATQVLPVINVKEDIDKLNNFVMDCIRAVNTGKKKVGGLGYVKTQAVGCIDRGRGRNVKANRSKTESEIKGYLSIGCAQNALRTSSAAYNTLVNTL